MKTNRIYTNGLKVLVPFLVLALFGIHSNAQTISSNQTGTHDGYYWSFWTEGGGTASMTLGPDGNYSSTWTNIQNFTCGKGWRTGTRDRVVCFEGSYDGGTNGFLAVYGWTINDLIEYYVVEAHGQWHPPGNTSDIEHLGTFTSDGGTYDVYRSLRVDKPSIIGTATFYQFWSVRQQQRTSGTVTFANHVDQWESYGLQLGSTWDYQIMETEGYGSTGSSNITVWECETSNVDVELTSPETGTTYDAPANITLSASASSTGGNITRVDFYNGTTLIGSATSAPYTYTWSNVPAGRYDITAAATDNTGDSNDSDPVRIDIFGPQLPYGGTPHPIPGTIQFEEFDEGGNGNAYFDDSDGTSVDPAPNFRNDEDVDIEECTDTGEGYNLGWTTAGEWLEYTVNVASAGTYSLDIRVATDGAGKTISLDIDETTIANNITIPNTGGWQTWETVTIDDITLNAGEQIIRLTIGAEDYVNLNYMTFTGNTTVPSIEITSPTNNSTYTTNDEVLVEVDASSEDATISSIQFLIDDEIVSTDESSPYSYSWTNLTVGSHDITAIVTDDNGSTNSQTITVTVEAAPQAIHLTAGWNLIGCPLDGDTPIEDALSSIWHNVEIIKNNQAYNINGGNTIFNLLQTVSYGRGYLVKVTADCELTW